jgi:hypothetical protein
MFGRLLYYLYIVSILSLINHANYKISKHKSMFQSSYQSGQYFELFDPKGTMYNDAANRDKDKVYRMIGPTGYHRIYDKSLKGIWKLYVGYVLEV